MNIRNMEINKKIKFIVLLVLFVGMGSQNVLAQTLEGYLQTATEKNPRIRAAYAEFEASLQRAPQVASLPDPTLTVSAFGRMIETRLGAQEARFTLMQMFPWFGTLRAQEDIANLRAEATFQEYLDLRNEVFLDVKTIYAELYALEKIIQLKQENLEILDSYRELALSRFKSGNAPMVNVVKVDIQRDAALTEIELLQDQKRPLQTQFNLLLQRERWASVEIEDTLIFNYFERIIDTTGVFKDHPRVTGLERQRRSYEMEETLAKKEGLPMIGLGVDYSVISKRMDANPEMNGQDAIMPMLSVTLPIFRKKYKAARKEAELMGESIEQQQAVQTNELQNEYEMAVYELNRANKLLTLYEKQLNSSAQANKLLISAFSNATGDFEEVLEINQDILMYQTEKIEAIKTGIIAQARLEYLFSKYEEYENK